MSKNSQHLLEIDDLRTYFHSREGLVRAVDGVSYSLDEGETLGVVGESGCGKSVAAMSILRLIPTPPGEFASGEIRFEGKNLLALDDAQMQAIRGNDISMIFQEPMTSLNPVMTIGAQISEAIRLHQNFSRKDAWDRAIEMLSLVRISEPAQRTREYPHQLSGGMRQRVMIAMALSCNPKVLIADEPTTALDVTIQAQILELMSELQEKTGTAIIMITHDLGVIAETAKRVVVMYAGRKVEEASAIDLFENPQHAYTEGLLQSIPKVSASLRRKQPERLNEIPGIVPLLHHLPPGCLFAPRCPYADTQCHQESPPLEEKKPGHFAACWHSKQLKGGV